MTHPTVEPFHAFEHPTVESLISTEQGLTLFDNQLSDDENAAVFRDLLGLEARMIAFFQSEGIHTVVDFFELTSEVIDSVVDNARKPGPTPAAAVGQPAIATAPYKVPATSVHRMMCLKFWSNMSISLVHDPL